MILKGCIVLAFVLMVSKGVFPWFFYLFSGLSRFRARLSTYESDVDVGELEEISDGNDR
jgi:hypothetical protein